jgi:hypothetical protein
MLAMNMVPHFRDEMYRDVKTPGYNVQRHIVRDYLYGDIKFGDVSSMYRPKSHRATWGWTNDQGTKIDV